MTWRIVPAASLALLIALLTWLLVKGMAIDAPGYERATRALDAFGIGQASLTRDVLRARAGLLRDYDPLVADVVQMRAAVATLRDIENVPVVEALSNAVARQEGLTERLKSDNALLQNSLSYFDVISSRLEADPGTAQAGQAIALLASAMLHLTLDTSPAAGQLVQSRLDDVLRETSAIPDQIAVQRLLAHARLANTVLPTVDTMLKQLLAAADGRAPADVRAMFNAQYAAAARLSGYYRYGLYASSLLLLLLLTRFAVRLRASAVALQRRAALELVIARLSTRLINCATDDLTGTIEQGLADLARCIGVDRAYLVLLSPGEISPGIFAWTKPDAVSPAGWPQQAPALMETVDGDSSRIAHLPRVARLPAGLTRRALNLAGVRSWLCLNMPLSGAGTGVLGFDSTRSTLDWPMRELALLQLAADAFAGVLGRQSLEFHRSMLETRIHQARRMEAVGALASGIAHNFNNIVGSIAGYAEMAEAEVGARSQAARHVGEISRAAGRARDLVSHILAFGKPRTMRRRPLQAHAVFEETVSLFSASLSGNTRLAAKSMQERAIVMGDFVQLQQVVLNLCTNAAQAMTDGGTVTLRMDLHSTGGRRLSHGTLKPGHHLRLTVSDTGHGMDGATIRRIFEPFFTTRPTGTGLGLATVIEIVREHGGAIDVQSSLGIGTTIETWLPIVKEPLDGDDGAGLLELGSSQIVLLIESDAEQRLRAEEIIAALGYEPVGFADPEDAIAACQREPDRFDVMLTDYHVPGRSGFDVAADLHTAAPGAALLLAAQFTVELHAGELAEIGVTEVVIKPFASSDLAAALSRCLTRKAAKPAREGPRASVA